MTDQPTKPTAASNYKSILVLGDSVTECVRVLRGHNGEPGFVARVISLEKSLEELKTEDLPDLKQSILDEIGRLRKDIERDIQDKTKYVLPWTKVISGFVFPVFLSVFSSVVMVWLLVKLGLGS
jgi:hypothetical protein